MSWIEIIADRKIRDAQEEGAFDDLPGKGKPLKLEFDPRIPPEQRAAYRLMKEAQLLPDWIQLDKEVRQREEQWRTRVEEFARGREPDHSRPDEDRRRSDESPSPVVPRRCRDRRRYEHRGRQHHRQFLACAREAQGPDSDRAQRQDRRRQYVQCSSGHWRRCLDCAGCGHHR